MTERTTRDAPISYRPPTELREAFHARVEASGLSVNAFITQAIFAQDAPRQRRRAPVEQQTIARLLAEAARLPDRLNAVGSVADVDAALLEEAVRDLRELRAALSCGPGEGAMIPKASQRAGGQDLTTHLLNAFDNEYVEVAEVRGVIATDLHGAFAEWEAIAHALTKCRNYLYSLLVNPDLAQGQLSRDQYRDYAQRVEEAMGLTGQPRVLVFHIKNGREHCHIVWSRIDAQVGKAIHQAFDHEKLMMVTQEFARDHGLSLPAGYERGGDDRKRKSL